MDALADRFTCITFDHRGVGDSDRGVTPVMVEQMAADAIAVLDAAGVGAAHLVGHSLDGPVALHLALAARHRARSLALLCSFTRGAGVGPLSWRLVWAGMRMKVGTRAMRRRAFLELVVPPGCATDPDAVRGVGRGVPRGHLTNPDRVNALLAAHLTASETGSAAERSR